MHSTIFPSQPKVNTENAFNWLKDAKVVNKKMTPISYNTLHENADIICLLFNKIGCDRDGIIRKFYNIYENSKYVNIPIEVIYVPLDETATDFRRSFKEQANWFALKFDDPVIHVIKFMYEITCVPQLRVINNNCALISRDGIGDLEQYGQNAVITWLPTAASSKKHRNFKNDADLYGTQWNYIDIHRRSSSFDRKSKARGWSFSEGDDKRIGQKGSMSSKSDNDDDDKRKPFYESGKY